MPTKLKPARLTVAQIELVGQFNDLAWENPKLGFEAVANKALGLNPFPKTPNGRKLRVGCKNVFELERELVSAGSSRRSTFDPETTDPIPQYPSLSRNWAKWQGRKD
jgi:hypothetical protein